MNNEHPITPPPKLVGEWLCNDGYPWDPSANAVITITRNRLSNVAAKAALWGADLELKACCDAIYEHEGMPLCGGTAEWLRNSRRPKPPSLKERALEVLGRVSKDGYPCNYQDDEDWNTIRQALELLPDEVQ